MREAQKKEKSRRQDATHRRAGKHAAVAERVSDRVWAGQHAQAIKLVTEALAEPGLSVGVQLDLLDLRAESFIAQGELEHASADAQAMLDLAETQRDGSIQGAGAQPPRAGANAQGEYKTAVASATAALTAARQSKQVGLEAMSLLRLGEAQFRTRLGFEQALRNATRAANLFHALGRSTDEGRARWAIAGDTQMPRVVPPNQIRRPTPHWPYVGRQATCTAPAMRSTCSCSTRPISPPS